ncbi:DUF4232 domain-containing protein [Streptomyces sp. NPDC096132]|uniref:DUF4232 domain-containing protein n=1 Tax=Streptomyces sp. NPDC096132 TaxID=3366075 RepID=UPI003802B20C
MSARIRSTRRTRTTRVFVAAALAAAALSLTACNNGEGAKDEGASSVGFASDASATPSTGSTGSSGLTDTQNSTGSTGSKGSKGSKGSTGSTGSTGSKTSSGGSKAASGGSKGSSGSSDSSIDEGSDATLNPCTPSSTRTTATEVSRPLNHMLLTVTNTGSKNCDLVYYPAVAFEDAQSVPPVIEDSQPQAVVTLAPGESGYAGILLSAADGSDPNGRTAKSLEVYFNTDATVPAKPSLPAKGVYIDGSIQVTYWQSTMADALQW